MNGLLRKIVLVGEPMDHNAIGKRTPPGLDPHCLRWYPTNTITFNIATGETSQVITSRHFSSLLFTSMSNLTSLALNQLKGKYNV